MDLHRQLLPVFPTSECMSERLGYIPSLTLVVCIGRRSCEARGAAGLGYRKCWLCAVVMGMRLVVEQGGSSENRL